MIWKWTWRILAALALLYGVLLLTLDDINIGNLLYIVYAVGLWFIAEKIPKKIFHNKRFFTTFCILLLVWGTSFVIIETRIIIGGQSDML